MKVGLIHLYAGDGKGKTTAAVGLSVRAAGNGLNVWFLQFMKGRPSGEIKILEQLPQVTVRRGTCEKFSFQMTSEEKDKVRKLHDCLLDEALQKLDQIDLLIMDEVLSAVNTGLISEEPLKQLLENKPKHLELVMTGRDPKPYIIDSADYYSEIIKRKHPFDQGVCARKGIEE